MDIQVKRLVANLKFSSEEQRKVTITALVEKGQLAVGPLLEVIRSNDSDVRKAATQTLLVICRSSGDVPKTKRAKQLIGCAIRDRRQEVRLAVTHMLDDLPPVF